MTRRRWIYPSDGSEPFEVSSDYTAAHSGPLVFGDLPSYQSPIDGRWVDGRVARRADLARSGCRPWEGLAEERKEAGRQQNYEAERQDRRLHTAIEQSIGQISEHSRRTLLNL